MKSSTPALYLYFITCFLCILFFLIGMEWMVAYAKAMVIPSIWYYYLASNNYKIDWVKSAVFGLCFIGDIFIMMDYDHSFINSLFCFFSVYMFLLWYFISDFNIRKFRKIDILPITIVILFLTYLLITIFGLKFNGLGKHLAIFLLYAAVLEILGVIGILNFIIRGSRLSVFAVLMWICFLLSDIFHLLYNYYFYLPVFQVIAIASQVFSYFFMARYFLERKQCEKNKAIGNIAV